MVYRHPAKDQRGFKLTIARLVDCGACRQVEILTAFGISKSYLARALRNHRAGGIDAFFKRPARPRRGRVLTPEVLLEAQRLLDEGQSKAAVAAQLGVPLDTLRRAVWDDRLSEVRSPDVIDSFLLDYEGSVRAEGFRYDFDPSSSTVLPGGSLGNGIETIIDPGGAALRLGVGGCGRVWAGVGGCGRVWAGVGGCGRVWELVGVGGSWWE